VRGGGALVLAHTGRMATPSQSDRGEPASEPPAVQLPDLTAEVEAQVRAWLRTASQARSSPSAIRLASLLRDPQGLPFAVGFIDGVIRPEDPHVAARALRQLAGKIPGFLPAYLRVAMRLGAAGSRISPGLVLPVVRRVLRGMVGHLVVDATDHRIGPAIARLRTDGVRLNINLLGEAVLGEAQAARRLEGTKRLLARHDVDYVSVKVSAVVGPHSPWAFEDAVAHVVEQLLPLYLLAARSRSPKFINLDMEEYRDLDLTLAVFTRLLDRPELHQLEAGIVLQAYLPDALAAMIRLQDWASVRRANAGAPIKVRLVKGANLPMERVDSVVHGWPLATWSTKQETDTNYKRVLDFAFHPGRIDQVRIGVAGHNLFDVAFAWILAGRRGVRHGLEFEMLLGMAQAQAEAVRQTVGGLLLYTPVVHPGEFDVAIAYLIRRLEEGASEDNFMSAVFDLATDDVLFGRELGRFASSLAAVDDRVPSPNRVQDRRTPAPEGAGQGFANVADTDPSAPGNRAWVSAILDAVPTSTVGADTTTAHVVRSAQELEALIQGAVDGAPAWGGRTGAERARILRSAALALERRRGDLLEVMAAEAGKTIDQSDPEVSEAVDFAHYYADRAEDLDAFDGARAIPVPLTVVTPPWNFPVAIPAGSVLGALAAGSAVIIKPATQARRCGSAMVEALWDAGVPREVLRLVHLEEATLGRSLIADPRVSRVILTGAFETAQLFRRFRPTLPLLAETSGKNAIIVTPSADLDLAAKDVAQSAFGHAGQKCSAASLVILVGSVSRSRRFQDQLQDAVTSLRVGRPDLAHTQMGPLIEPASGKLLRALTQLSDGESWLVRPCRRDSSGTVWSPGVKTGVRRGSEFHLTECFGPVLGVMTARTLHEAIDLQNDVAYGLTAGLHSLDAAEMDIWLHGVQAGNLYINRGITGAIVGRQPFGGWKKSAVGPGAKAGGPNYLVGLCDWESRPAVGGQECGQDARRLVEAAAMAGLSGADRGFLERALRSDAAAWNDEFGRTRDLAGLGIERNLFRYLPTPVHVRLTAEGSLAHLIRVVAASVVAGSQIDLSSGQPVPTAVGDAFQALGVNCVVEADGQWSASLNARDPGRLRLVGGDAADVARATDGRPDVAVYAQPVTEAGRLELLPFLLEQSVSIMAHRFGTPDARSQAVI
jgi:RHH-type proline utilization regulon transcriptional repressor/proline dehydrogenase/delta 1-pyrroline-5-carboxylate dehydrogenase